MLSTEMDEKGGHGPSLSMQKTHLVKKSINEFIELIITTHQGEYKFDRELGFEIWDIEFENIQIEKFNTHNFPKQNLEKYLQSKLEKFEPRLKNIKVEILFIHSKVFKGKMIKFFVDITVRGNLIGNNENYVKTFQFGMGPFLK